MMTPITTTTIYPTACDSGGWTLEMPSRTYKFGIMQYRKLTAQENWEINFHEGNHRDME
jgi:hypothetical protein